jgi:DNA-directed RNA polymerase subunit K
VFSARVLQLAQGAPVLVKLSGERQLIEIAQLEFEKGVLPLTVVREMPDGTKLLLDMKGEEIGKTEK